MSTRTFIRRLALEQKSYQQLLDVVREERSHGTPSFGMIRQA